MLEVAAGTRNAPGIAIGAIGCSALASCDDGGGTGDGVDAPCKSAAYGLSVLAGGVPMNATSPVETSGTSTTARSRAGKSRAAAVSFACSSCSSAASPKMTTAAGDSGELTGAPRMPPRSRQMSSIDAIAK
eukprot:Amastigsp_a186474_2.p3 type:complete len:131 gc:universal Amastigsp_a186474_2:429-37(-)